MKNIERRGEHIYILKNNRIALFTNDIDFINVGTPNIPKKVLKYLQKNPDCEYLEIVNKIKLPKKNGK